MNIQVNGLLMQVNDLITVPEIELQTPPNSVVSRSWTVNNKMTQEQKVVTPRASAEAREDYLEMIGELIQNEGLCICLGYRREDECIKAERYFDHKET